MQERSRVISGYGDGLRSGGWIEPVETRSLSGALRFSVSPWTSHSLGSSQGIRPRPTAAEAPVTTLGSRIGRRLGAFEQVFQNARLRRLELAWGGFWLSEWMQFVALSIYAFDVGGARALGALGVVRMAPAALALPFAGLLNDRYPRHRVLLGINLARAGALGVTAVALAADGPRLLVFALAGCAAVAAAAVRPTTMSLVPLLARTPEQLVGANVASSTLEALGAFLGPVAGGVLAATGGPEVGVGVAGAFCLWCALLVGRIHRGHAPTVRHRAERNVVEELVGGVRALAREARPRLIVLLFAAQALVRGILNVLLVVVAEELLGLGTSGVGWLIGAIGAGGLLGGLAAISLTGRRRLAGPFGLALVLWGAPIALIGAWPGVALAVSCLAVVGLGNALLDISGFTLIQRTVDEQVLGRVFGVFEVLVAVAVGAGSVLGSVAEVDTGIRHALLITGAILPALALISFSRLREIDRSVEVPVRELELLSSIPLFAPLPVTSLERLASHLREVKAKAGTRIVEQGTTGDVYYAIADGTVDVEHDGRHVATLGPGDYFGEIALLSDATRTATCIARGDVDLYTLDRKTFVAAVASDTESTGAAEDVMAERLARTGTTPAPPA
jgi:MFS family permease